MPETPHQRWASVVATASVLTDEQKQRVHALRAAREVIEVRPAAGPFVAAGTDFKDYLLIAVAQWIIDGELIPAAQFEVDMDRWMATKELGSGD